MDIKEAFDTVWHDGVLHKMSSHGFPSYILQLIQSFLQNRSFKVKVDDAFSTHIAASAGIPQCSKLGATLYNIFIADIPVPKDCELAVYAEDTAIISASRIPLSYCLILGFQRAA